jgi:hypothetical protein
MVRIRRGSLTQHQPFKIAQGEEWTMKRSATTIHMVITLLFVAGSAQARAQNVLTFNPEQVPAEGRRPQDFLPRDWKIGARAEGDLNGDHLPDHVLQLVPHDYDSSGISAAPEAQALLILLSADGGGRLQRTGLATKLLMPVVPQYILAMSIRNGVLVINQNFGMTDVTDLTHRLRYEPTAGRFQLIGKDTFNYHRPQGPNWPATRISENYLTGARLTTTDRRLRNGMNKPTTKRGQVARAPVFIEDVDEASNN